MNRSTRLHDLGDRDLRQLARIDQRRIDRTQRREVAALTTSPSSRRMLEKSRVEVHAVITVKGAPRPSGEMTPRRSWRRRSLVFFDFLTDLEQRMTAASVATRGAHHRSDPIATIEAPVQSNPINLDAAATETLLLRSSAESRSEWAVFVDSPLLVRSDSLSEVPHVHAPLTTRFLAIDFSNAGGGDSPVAEHLTRSAR